MIQLPRFNRKKPEVKHMATRIEDLHILMITKIIAFGFFLTLGLFSGELAAISQSADLSFDCLSQSGPTEVVSGFFNSKFKPTVAPNKKFDARNASFEIPETISHSIIVLKGSGDNSGMCWAGGFVTSSVSWHDLDISWDQSKHGNDGDDGLMNNTTSAISYENRMMWTGIHVYNVHDGIRPSNTYNNWTVQHVWLDYIRDDCIENDHIYSGKVYDSLFDGCYTGISVRPSSSGKGEGQGQTVTVDKVLLRMEPMPYPYKWDTKDDPTITVSGYENIPFGYGKVFKMDKGNEPEFKITNSVFLSPLSIRNRYFGHQALWYLPSYSAFDNFLNCFTEYLLLIFRVTTTQILGRYSFYVKLSNLTA